MSRGGAGWIIEVPSLLMLQQYVLKTVMYMFCLEDGYGLRHVFHRQPQRLEDGAA